MAVSLNAKKWLITIILPLMFFVFPTSEYYTQDLQIFFCITAFIILIVAFDLIELLIPSIMLPTLYFLSGIAPINIAFGSWSNTTVWMILGALILAQVLEECGLLRRIAIYCIRRCGGTFTGTLYGVFIAGLVISFVTFSQAFIIMMTLTYGICQAMKLERSDYSALMCFVGMMGGITTCTFMYNPGYLALGEAGIRTIDPTFTVQWYDGFLYNGLYVFLFIGLIFFLSKFFHTDRVQFEGGSEYFNQEYKKMGPLSKKEKKALIVVLLLMVYLFTSPIHGYPAAYGFMVAPFTLFFPGIDVGTAASAKKTNFSIIFFISSCLGIGMVSSYLGAEKLISSLVDPILEGQSHLVVFLIMLAFGAICNMFMTPYAMMAALSMPFAALTGDVGIDPLAGVMSLMISTDLIFLPHEVAGCLLMYSFGLISMGNFVKLYTLKTFISVVFFIVVIYPLWEVLGLVTK